MSDCTFTSRVEAYHDNLLSEADQALVDSHLQDCEPCRKWLAELESISRLFAEAAREGLSDAGRRRIHRHLDDLLDRGLLRLEWMFSGIAAAVVIGASLWLVHLSEPQPTAAPPWVSVVSLNDATPAQREAVTPVAQWYLAEAPTHEAATQVDEAP